MIRFCMATTFATASSDRPRLLAMRPDCSGTSRSPDTPGPASDTTNAVAGWRAATTAAMRPPSLWPMRPMRLGSISFCAFRKAIPASTSVAWPSTVAFAADTVVLPVERSSTRSTAMP